MESEMVISENVRDSIMLALEAKGIEAYGTTLWDYLGIEEVIVE